MTYRVMFLSVLVLLLSQFSAAQNKRDAAVRSDKKVLSKDTSWFYDDLETALRAAARSKRPLMVVFR